MHRQDSASASTRSAARGAAGARARSLAPRFAAVLEKLGTGGFGRALLDFLRSEVRYDSALAVCYRLDRRPTLVCEEFAHPLRRNTVDEYLSGAYREDPVYQRATRIRVPSVVRMRDVAPADFRCSDYFIGYYRQSAVADEVNYLVPVDFGRVVAVRVERSVASCEFRDDEVSRLEAWLPLVSAAVVRHTRSVTAPPADRGSDPEQHSSERLLAAIGARKLTRRETQILNRMLGGQSMRAIASGLDVSVGTIRVHRRNIYRKLSVNSVSQLFSLALDSALAGARPRGADWTRLSRVEGAGRARHFPASSGAHRGGRGA